jgi:excisionase family DNA binding protein
MANTKNEEWVSPAELADEIRRPVQTVYAWQHKGTGPKAYRLGRHLRYRRSDLEAWLEQQASDA